MYTGINRTNVQESVRKKKCRPIREKEEIVTFNGWGAAPSGVGHRGRGWRGVGVAFGGVGVVEASGCSGVAVGGVGCSGEAISWRTMFRTVRAGFGKRMPENCQVPNI